MIEPPEVIPEVELGVSDFVAVLNQTLEMAYGSVVIFGELANLRVSKNRWLYFDLKDDNATVKFFGTVYMLPGPLEDGMMLKVRGQPRLHPQYGFSVNASSIRPAGEGAIKKAADLLASKLKAEGLFDDSRKRLLPHPPERIGLITSKQSAAFADFKKILNARWQGLDIQLIDVQVQGEAAPGQIVAALEQFNKQALLPDVLVLIRGGGSAEDLSAFSTEQVTRAVAGSRIPTLVAIGHEVDWSLAELAADQRASTPSNAAELLVPDRQHSLEQLKATHVLLSRAVRQNLQSAQNQISKQLDRLNNSWQSYFEVVSHSLQLKIQLLAAFSPENTLNRGYAIVRAGGVVLKSTDNLETGTIIDVQLAVGNFTAGVQEVKHVKHQEN